MHAVQFAHIFHGGRPRFNRGFHRAHIAADHHRDKPGADLLPAHERDVCSFHHRIGRLDRTDQAACLNHTEC